MKEQKIMRDWLFFDGLPDRFGVVEKKVVQLPHDAMIGFRSTPKYSRESSPGVLNDTIKFQMNV